MVPRQSVLMLLVFKYNRPAILGWLTKGGDENGGSVLDWFGDPFLNYPFRPPVRFLILSAAQEIFQETVF